MNGVIRESQVPSETIAEELLLTSDIGLTPEEELLDSPIEEIPEELDSFVTVTEEELDSSVPIEELESSETLLILEEPLSPPHPAKDMIEISSNPMMKINDSFFIAFILLVEF